MIVILAIKRDAKRRLFFIRFQWYPLRLQRRYSRASFEGAQIRPG